MATEGLHILDPLIIVYAIEACEQQELMRAWGGGGCMGRKGVEWNKGVARVQTGGWRSGSVIN